ncbi:MAG: bifunctional glutamate N-acetyltransferase/amino-acid acetyltransferase ArgJ [Thiotrichales bacterium]|nr:MAG: bifunctional glutamate N-acetyltransferase/amino-acid acetyltransferase ArgJ [Thiotrichales bacterium]
MAVGLSRPDNIHPVNGVQLASVSAGIKNDHKPDLVLIEFEAGTVCAGVFTRNAFSAAPVTVAKKHLMQARPRALLINSGNANAGTGDQGLQDAEACCAMLASALSCSQDEVLPFSTGVIGEYLPMDKIEAAVPGLADRLAADAWLDAADAIMTTDTVAKACSSSVQIDGVEVTISGIAKGAGMIRPDMATMLAFIATDAAVSADWLQRSLESGVDVSFNRISVDGDTSTNDACMLAATGASGCRTLAGECDGSVRFQQALNEVLVQLAQAIVRDGEGATKFVTVRVESAASLDEASRVAYTVAHSPLVKTALFASDPNWGRILAAVGRAGVDDLDISAVGIYLGDVCIVSKGGRDPRYEESMGQAVMQQQELTIRIVLNRGSEQISVWTTDLSYDYVKINAEYRT